MMFECVQCMFDLFVLIVLLFSLLLHLPPPQQHQTSTIIHPFMEPASWRR